MNAEEEGKAEGQDTESLRVEESEMYADSDADAVMEVDDEDEDVCRVCRCPAEPGRPLFTPCKCSGSMGMTHQDCLTSWLEVTRGDGECLEQKFDFFSYYLVLLGRSHCINKI